MAVAILAAAVTLRPPIVAIGPLAPRMAQDLGVSFAWLGLITTASIVLMGLASPLGPGLLERLGFRVGVSVCLLGLLAAGIARAFAFDYALVLFWSAVLGVIIGIGQSIVPALGREWSLAPRLASGSFSIGLVGSSIVAAAVVVPLASWTGGWRPALLALTIPVIASLALWLRSVPGARVARPPTRSLRIRPPLHDPEARWLALCFGLQGVLYHSLVAWLATVAVESGASETEGGTLVALLNVAALTATISVLFFGGRTGPPGLQLVAVSALALGGALALAAGAPLGVAAIILGFSLGAILPLLVQLSLARSSDPAQASAIIALVFLVGYVMAGLAPTVIGSVRDLTGDFGPALWLLAADGLLLLAVAIRVRRPRQVAA